MKALRTPRVRPFAQMGFVLPASGIFPGRPLSFTSVKTVAPVLPKEGDAVL